MPDDHAGRIVYLRDACAGFTSLARQIDLDAPVWAFWTTQPARFWVKRAATELAVHTWDAQDAVGDPDRIDPTRAATSIDESLRGLWPGLIAIGHHLSPDDGPTPPNTPAGFLATDTGHRWSVDPTGDALGARVLRGRPGRYTTVQSELAQRSVAAWSIAARACLTMALRFIASPLAASDS